MKKHFRMVIAMTLSILLVFSFGASSFANVENDFPAQTDAQELPAEAYEIIAESNNSFANQKIDDTPSVINMMARATEFNYQGTLTAQGQIAWVYPILLQPNQCVQAMLQCPASTNLDYDLYLYEFDSATGTTGSSPVDSSTYATYFNRYPDGSNKTLPEAVGIINSSSAAKEYAIGVHSKVGGDAAYPFTLSVSLDVSGNFNPGEYNQNAFHPITASPTDLVSGAAINSVSDNDRYKVRMPNPGTIKFTAEPSTVVRELYVANGSKMQLVSPSSDGTYSVSGGYYYVRVCASVTNFTPSIYTLRISALTPLPPPPAKAAKIRITGYNSDKGPDSYANYGRYGTHYSFTGDLQDKNVKLVLNGQLLDSNGLPTAQSGVSIAGQWISGHWPEGHYGYTRTSSAVTGSDGSFSMVFDHMPISAGSSSYYIDGAIDFTHYFDVDGIAVWAKNDSSISHATDVVFNFSYSIYIG